MPADPRSYEVLVRELLEARLRDDCPDAQLRVFHDKRYRGKSGHEHQIDVAAELELAEVRILILVECKHYSRKVGIDDVMELATRIEDIGAHKGIIVTTVGFQEGAVRIAKAKGIALVTAHELVWVPMLHCPSPWLENQMKRAENLQKFVGWFFGINDATVIPTELAASLAATDFDFHHGDYFERESGLVANDEEGRARLAFYVAADGLDDVKLDGSAMFRLFAVELYAKRQQVKS